MEDEEKEDTTDTSVRMALQKQNKLEHMKRLIPCISDSTVAVRNNVIIKMQQPTVGNSQMYSRRNMILVPCIFQVPVFAQIEPLLLLEYVQNHECQQ